MHACNPKNPPAIVGIRATRIALEKLVIKEVQWGFIRRYCHGTSFIKGTPIL